MSRLLNPKDFYLLVSLPSSYPPHTFINNCSFQNCDTLALHTVSERWNRANRTVQKACRKIDTHVSIPCTLPSSLYCSRYASSIQLLDTFEKSVLRSEPNNDLRHAQQK